MKIRVVSLGWAAAILTSFAGNLPAGTVSTFFNNVRYFPASDGTVSDTANGTLTAATVDSHETTFSSTPGNNTFDGLDTITGSPVLLGARNSVTINQATDSSFSGWLSFAVMAIDESGVTVTGASGTGYLLPTFHLRGTFDVGNPGLYGTLDTCDGNGSCIAASPAFDNGGSQPQNVDLFYTPGIDSTTNFQFGTPFSIHYGLDAFVGIVSGTTANPGGQVIDNFTMQLASIRVVNVDGSTIPGAQIHSTFVDLANVPEPGTAALSAVALLVALRSLRRKAA